jgi:hypothetical protein
MTGAVRLVIANRDDQSEIARVWSVYVPCKGDLLLISSGPQPSGYQAPREVFRIEQVVHVVKDGEQLQAWLYASPTAEMIL